MGKVNFDRQRENVLQLLRDRGNDLVSGPTLKGVFGYNKGKTRCSGGCQPRSAAPKNGASRHDDSSTKRCSTCRIPKDRSQFAKDRRRADGLRSQCKDCNKISKKRYRAENQHVIKAYTKSYYWSNREACQERTREWRKRNRETIAEYDRRRRQECSEQIKAYYRENKAQFDHHRRQRQARLKGAPGTHTEEEILQMIEDQGGLCAYCGASLEDGFHVDHMLPISRGGTNDWSNIAITCPFCNWSKNDNTAEEFWTYLQGRMGT